MAGILDMAQVQYFKAAKQTNRFNANQKVWIRLRCANHLHIYHKWRGSGRYVTGIIDRFAPAVGELMTIDVKDDFAQRIEGQNK